MKNTIPIMEMNTYGNISVANSKDPYLFIR